jgi:pyruvate/2-oxoglutarate dehydrogenase complex dihydrolipoamide dehydrogenase (E3) component
MKMKVNNYDITILGGGAAGLVAAKVARGLDKKVAILEKKVLGGGCTWTGCVPSKAMIHLANRITLAKKSEQLRLLQISDIFTDKVLKLVREKRNEIYQTHTPEMLQQEGIDVYFGTPKFIDTFSVQMGDNLFRSDKWILATGSTALIPPIEGLKDISYFTDQTIFELETLPRSIVILGGGPVGIEMGCALSALGVHVTIIEMNETILSKEDRELSDALKEKLIREEKISILTSLKLEKVAQKGESIIFFCNAVKDGKKEELCADALFIAVGRRPNIDGMNLEHIGVRVTSQGIVVNKKLQTSIAHIYACGDTVGPYLFSHMAEYQAVVATTNALIPFFKRSVNYENVVWITFSNPELASAGLTEAQAREKYGNTIAVYRVKYDEIDRAKIDNNIFGLSKVICDAKGRIIGAHILGAHAGELIHEFQLGKFYHVYIQDFYHPIHAYPTYSELIWRGAKRAYVDYISNKWYIKLLTKFFK